MLVGFVGLYSLPGEASFHSTEANTHVVSRLLEAAPADEANDARAGAQLANTVFGIVSLKLHGVYSFMNLYGPGEREQIAFWESLLDEHILDGNFFNLHVMQSASLEERAPLLQCSDRKLRGFVVRLEVGQAERLWNSLSPEIRESIGGVPTIAMRLPPQHAMLVLRREWRSIMAPHMPALRQAGGGRRGGSISMNIDWQLLGVQQPETDDPPDILEMSPGLDSATCLQIADRLRQVAASVDKNSDFREADYHNLQCFVHVLQTMHDQTHGTFLTKMVKDLRSRVSLSSLSSTESRKLKYNVSWMLRVLMLSDCLRSSANLAQAVKQSLHMFVPPVVLPVFQSVLSDPSALQPDLGTVSRWRLLLDGAFMLWHRSRNASQGVCAT